MSGSRTRVAAAVLLALAAAVYLVDLGGSSIWDANEAFYVETPREMIERGDYLNPSFNYEPRFNKPVLAYWLVAGLYQLFGVSVAVQRGAIAAAALLIIAAAWLLARAASREALAPVLAAAGLAVNPRFFMFARRILIDVMLAALMTLALLFFVLAEREPRRRRTYLVAMYVCVGLGVLTKGPVAIVLPALVFALYLAAHRELRRLRDMMLPAGAFIVTAIVAPWYMALYLESGWTHITEFFIGENVGRFTELVGPQARGPLFYLPVVLSDGLPWSLGLPAAVAIWMGERRTGDDGTGRRIRTLLLVWIAGLVGFFSLSQTKQDLYILPIVAAVAALGGDVAARAVRGEATARRWFAGTLVAAGALLAGLGAAVVWVFTGEDAVYALDGAHFVGITAAAAGIVVAVLGARQRAAAGAVVLLAAFLTINAALVLRVLPAFEAYKPVVPLSQVVAARAQPGDLVVHYDVALPSMVYYLRRHVEMTFERGPFLDLMRSGRPVFAVLPEDRYHELRHELRDTCLLARHATFDAKLREVVSRRPLPAIVVIATRCG